MDMTKNVGSGSARYNSGKVRMTYIPPGIQLALQHYCDTDYKDVPVRGLTALAEHFSLGAAKYADSVDENGFAFPNWAKGQYFDFFLINCIERHYYAFQSGEQFDEDFGSHHLIAVAWGIACLHHQFINYELYAQFDDRMWVGFKLPHSSYLEEEMTTLELLMHVSVEPDIIIAANVLTTMFYRVLELYERNFKHELTFKINEQRLEKIRNTDYGTPNVTKSSKS